MAKKTNSSSGLSGNTIWFVSHPYGEPAGRMLQNGICLWNVSDVHKRKNLRSENATVIDMNGNVLPGQDITFVGEWECCSSYVPNPPKSDFKRLHTPIYSQHDASVDCLNTDPFVFGKEFYYCCCKLKKARFDKIKLGDIVVFGSYTMNGRVDKMVVDTVLVVNKIIEKSDIGKYNFSQCYRDVTISKLKDKPCDYSFNGVIVGKMYETSKSYNDNLPFSFVPCCRSGVMSKVVIDRTFVINGKTATFGIGQSGGHLDVIDINDFFNQLVNKIRKANCELGVYMPEPQLTLNNATINNAAQQIKSGSNSKKCNNTKK